MPEPDPRFEVPPEYAEVYEQAFRRASNTQPEDPDHAGGDKGTVRSDDGRRSWWVRRPATLGPLVLMLVVVALAAYVVGRSSLSNGSTPDPVEGPASSAVSASPTPTPTSSKIPPVLAATFCQEPRVSDGEGNTLSFAPGNALDDDPATSWACSGTAVGQQLVLTLPKGSRVTAVGLLPTAMVGGVAINRIHAVDWIFDDGTTVRQNVADPSSAVQVQSVPATTSRTVRLRLASVSSGPADVTAVSSVVLTGSPR